MKLYKLFEKKCSSLSHYHHKYGRGVGGNNYSCIYAKVISLSYLVIEAEKIFFNPKNNHPVSDIIKIIDKSKNIFESLITFQKFQDKHIKNVEVNKSFKSYHKNLWNNVWPEYHNQKDLIDLINWRGARIDYNKINEFKNKNIIDFGCGNGSTSFAFLKRGQNIVI